MPENQGQDWTLNVVINDDQAKKQLGELEAKLKEVAKIDFEKIEASINGILKSLSTFSSAASSAYQALSPIKDYVKELGQTTLKTPQIETPAIPIVGQTNLPTLTSPVTLIINVDQFVKDIADLKAKVAKGSALFSVRPQIDKESISRIKTEIQKLSDIAKVKLQFSEKDASGVVYNLIEMLNKVNATIKPDIDQQSLNAIHRQIKSVLQTSADVLGPELTKAIERANLSELRGILKRYSIEGITDGVGGADTKSITPKVKKAIEIGGEEADLTILSIETEKALRKGISQGLEELRNAEPALKNALSYGEKFNRLSEELADAIDEARPGERLVSDIKSRLNEMKAIVQEAYNVDSATVNRFFSPWQAHMTRMVNEMIGLTGDALVNKQRSLVDFATRKLSSENIELKFGIGGLSSALDVFDTLDLEAESLQKETQKIVDTAKQLEKIDLKVNTTNAKEKVKEIKSSLALASKIKVTADTSDVIKKFSEIKNAIFQLNPSSANNEIANAIGMWENFANELADAGGYSKELKTSLQALGPEINKLFQASTGKTFGELKKQLRESASSSNLISSNLVNVNSGLKSLITRANAIKSIKMGVSLAAWQTGFGGIDIAINQVIDTLANLKGAAGQMSNIAASAGAAGAAANAAAGSINRIPQTNLKNICGSLKAGLDSAATAATTLVKKMQYVGNTASQLSMAGIGMMFIQQYASTVFSKAMDDQSKLGESIINTALLIKQEYNTSIQEAEKVTVGMLNNVARTASNSREELGKAMQTTVQAGFANPKDLAFMMDVSDAVATSTNTNNVSMIAKMLSGVVFAFGVGTENAKTFGDQFAVALNKTSLDAEDLGTVINYTIGQTAALGIGFDKLLTYAAILRKGGMEPSSIGTSIRSLLIDVSSMKGELGKFIKSEGIGIPANIEQYGQFAEQYGAILEKRKEAAKQLESLQIKQKEQKASGMDTKQITKDIAGLQAQIGKYDQETNKLNETYGDVAKNATQFFGDVFKAVGKARKEGKITEEQFNKMFNTVQSTAANIFANSFSTQEAYIKELNKAIQESAGYSDQVREDKMQTVKGRTQRIQNELGRLMGLIYTSFSSSLTKIGELLFKYGPEAEKIFNIIGTELSKLMNIVYKITDAFFGWFTSLNDTAKSFIVNKALIIALAGIIGGPLMVYIGAVGSSMAGFSSIMLGASGTAAVLTEKLLSLANILVFGNDFRFIQSMGNIDKLRFYIDNVKNVLAEKGKLAFFDDIAAAATAPNFTAFKVAYTTGLDNMRERTSTSIESLLEMFIDLGTGFKTTGTGIFNVLKGLNFTSALGALRGGLQGVAMAIPMVTTGLITMTIAALPYITAIVAIVGAIFLLYTAWNENWGGIQEIAANAGKGIMDALGAVYDFIMSIVAPIVQVLQTIGEYFVKIFQAVTSGDWGSIIGIAEELSNKLTDIFINALMSIGSTIYNTISGFFSNTSKFVDDGGLVAIGGAILGFLTALVVTVGTVIVTAIARLYTFMYTTGAKLGVKFLGALGSFLFDVAVDMIAFIINGVLLTIPMFTASLMNTLIQALPLPDSVKQTIAKSFDMSSETIDAVKQSVTNIASGIKSSKNAVAADLSKWFDSAMPIDPRTEEQKAAGIAEGTSRKEGLKKGFGGAFTGFTNEISNLAGMGQVNPLSNAEQSSINIRDNISSTLSGVQSQYQFGINATMNAMPSFMQSQVKPDLTNLQYVPTTTPVDNYTAYNPPMTSNAYTINIHTMNVGTVEEAQEFMQNPSGTGEKPIINMGINVGT